MNIAWVVFEPLDAVTFRDGRPFSAGDDSLARVTFPWPTTTAGAIKEVLGGEPDEVAGPFVWKDKEPFFPTPLDVVVPEDVLGAPPERLGALRVEQGRLSTNLVVEELPSGRGKPCGGWVNGKQLKDYLWDGHPPQSIASSDEILRHERRVGLYRGEGRSAQEGFLYAAEFLRPQTEGIGFACRVRCSSNTAPQLKTTVVRLGGEARQTEVREVQAALPEAPSDFPEGRLLLYLATPGVFNSGWWPDQLDGASLVRACVEGPMPVSGWDLLQPRPQPRPVRWAITPGSIYFLRFGSPEAAATFAKLYHGNCLPQADDRLRTAGFGLCLVGRWG